MVLNLLLEFGQGDEVVQIVGGDVDAGASAAAKQDGIDELGPAKVDGVGVHRLEILGGEGVDVDVR